MLPAAVVDFGQVCLLSLQYVPAAGRQLRLPARADGPIRRQLLVHMPAEHGSGRDVLRILPFRPSRHFAGTVLRARRDHQRRLVLPQRICFRRRGLPASREHARRAQDDVRSGVGAASGVRG